MKPLHDASETSEPHDGLHDGPLAGLLAELGALGKAHVSVSVGDIMAALGARGHGPIMLTLAALMLLPMGMLPVMPSLIGVLLGLTGGQMLLGGKAVTLPGFLARRRFDGEHLRGALARAAPLGLRVSRVLRPRWRGLVESRVSLWLIALYLLSAAMVMVTLGAIPGLPFVLCLPVMLFGLGLTTGDGRVVALGFGLALPVAAALLALGPGVVQWFRS